MPLRSWRFLKSYEAPEVPDRHLGKASRTSWTSRAPRFWCSDAPGVPPQQIQGPQELQWLQGHQWRLAGWLAVHWLAGLSGWLTDWPACWPDCWLHLWEPLPVHSMQPRPTSPMTSIWSISTRKPVHGLWPGPTILWVCWLCSSALFLGSMQRMWTGFYEDSIGIKLRDHVIEYEAWSNSRWRIQSWDWKDK